MSQKGLSLFIAERFTSLSLRLQQQTGLQYLSLMASNILHTIWVFFWSSLKKRQRQITCFLQLHYKRIWMRCFWFLLFSEEHKDASFGCWEFSSKASVKISFGVISEVDLWKDAGKKKNTGGKNEKLQKWCFCFLLANEGSCRSETSKHIKPFLVSQQEKVFRCQCCQSCLRLSSLSWTSLWFILSSQCLLFASNYFPICFQTLTTCQHYTEAQMRESPDYKMP